MDQKPPSIRSLVVVPAILTLIVTLARLVGELNGWSPLLFGTATAGGANAILGISWLIFVFGLWFGFKVQRSGAGVAKPGKTLLFSLLPIALLFGGFAACQALGLVSLPTPEAPGEPKGLIWLLFLRSVRKEELFLPRVPNCFLTATYLVSCARLTMSTMDIPALV